MRNELRKKLDQYDHIFLFCRDVKWFEAAFAQSDTLEKTDKNIWIYSGSDVIYPDHISWGRINPEEETELIALYDTYEFSNCFHVISQYKICGSLFNYVDQGLLSVSEMMKALLC